jgi:repressor LexA
MLDNEATLKRFKSSGKKIQLIPENPAYAPIESDNITILGKLVGLLRKY